MTEFAFSLLPSADTAARLDICSLLTYIQNIVGFILETASALALFVIAYGAVSYQAAYSSPDKAEAAKKIIYAAVIGLIMMYVSVGTIVAFWDVFLGNRPATAQNAAPLTNINQVPQLSFLAFFTHGTIPGCQQTQPTAVPTTPTSTAAKPNPIAGAGATTKKDGTPAQTYVDQALVAAQTLYHLQFPTDASKLVYKAGCLGPLYGFTGWAVETQHRLPTSSHGGALGPTVSDLNNACQGYQHVIILNHDTGQYLGYR